MTPTTPPNPSFEQQTKTIVFDLATRLSELADVAHKGGHTLLIEPDAINNHVAAILTAHNAAVAQAVREFAK